MFNKEEISKRIKTRMKDLDLKQKDIVENAEISKPAMSNYMNGVRIPDTETIYKLSQILEMSIEEILTGKSTNVNKMTENEEELLENFKLLPEREQIKIIGIIENKAELYSRSNESSDSKIG